MSDDREAAPQNRLTALGDEIREGYAKNRRVMSFAEYVELAWARPRTQLRAAAQYIRDCFDHFGTEMVTGPAGDIRRFCLFDCPWENGRDRLIGQEPVQNRIYRALGNFVSEGAVNKLILLHGPNGSAKSTLIRCIGRALEAYSQTDEGALYRINWIFPAQKISKSGIGFSGQAYEEAKRGDTYAYLPDELVDARLSDELCDHPLFLIPAIRRTEMMREMMASADAGGAVLADYLQLGQLSHKNHAIYEALLTSYRGDYLKVLRHVQVERFYIGHRYREGYATVEPQLSVDANERQITADRSVSALPAALSSISLYEYGGELVAGNRGLVEYSDLLKRPLEAYKYLITTVESASVNLSSATLFLDLVFIGTSNELHLAAFKEIPEFQSFKGRLDLVRVPYLLDFAREEQIYEDKLSEAASSRHVAPHCAHVAALWAVLTRMRKPMADKYPKPVAELVSRLGPLAKAELYATGKAPESFSQAQAKELRKHLPLIARESEAYPNYEGRTGASPRELMTVLFNAASSDKYTYVSPLAIIEEIEELSRHASVYEFLKQEALPGGFHDQRKIIQMVQGRLIARIDDDVRSSLGLVEEQEYARIFLRYVTHVTHWTRGEKVRNPSTGRMEDPDETMMGEVERTIDPGHKSDDLRREMISKIGAWSLDHPGEKPDYSDIFAPYFRRLREAYFDDQRRMVKRGIDELLRFFAGEAQSMTASAKTRAETALATLEKRFGYNPDSARDAVSLLARSRYSD
ncbi:MAG TPA: hypothetical protein VFG83_14165 [Kofleriaceae bacterium]|nr:hypothetical protein [Kofleriaceae bacterium]